MTLEEAKRFIKRHINDIGSRVAEGDPLCTTIALLLDDYLEDPDNPDTVAALAKAVEEYRDTVVLRCDEELHHSRTLH